jgi:hypothetical protein
MDSKPSTLSELTSVQTLQRQGFNARKFGTNRSVMFNLLRTIVAMTVYKINTRHTCTYFNTD